MGNPGGGCNFFFCTLETILEFEEFSKIFPRGDPPDPPLCNTILVSSSTLKTWEDTITRNGDRRVFLARRIILQCSIFLFFGVWSPHGPGNNLEVKIV